MDWKPIETAPRDGTAVLVALPGVRPVYVSWRSGEWRYPFTVRRLKAYQPTHWMPLPAPPKA